MNIKGRTIGALIVAAYFVWAIIRVFRTDFSQEGIDFLSFVATITLVAGTIILTIWLIGESPNIHIPIPFAAWREKRENRRKERERLN